MSKVSEVQQTNQTQNGTRIAIQRIYGKNQQFEVKGLPTQLKNTTWNPTLNLQANPRYTSLDDNQYEVVLALQIAGQQSEEMTFQIYLEQAGVFTLADIDPAQLETILYGVCPNIIFPYANVTANQLLSNAGFPPVYLAPLDFIALYQQHQKEKQQQTTTPAAETISA